MLAPMDTMARARPYRCGLLLLASFLGPACLLHQQADRHAADDAAHGQSQEWSVRRRLHKVKSRRRLRPGSHLIHLRPRELSSPADGPPLLRFAVYSDTHYWVRSSTRSAWMRRVAAAPVRDGLVVDAAEEVLPLLLRQLSAFAASGADFAVHAGDAVCGGSSFQQAGRCTLPCLEMGHHSPPHSAGGEATPPPLPDPCPTSPAGGRRVRDDASAVPLARGLRTRHEPGPDHRPARALHDPSPDPSRRHELAGLPPARQPRHPPFGGGDARMAQGHVRQRVQRVRRGAALGTRLRCDRPRADHLPSGLRPRLAGAAP